MGGAESLAPISFGDAGGSKFLRRVTMPEQQKFEAGTWTREGLVVSDGGYSYLTLVNGRGQNNQYKEKLIVEDFDPKVIKEKLRPEVFGFMARGLDLMVGSDPEIFIKNKDTGVIVPAFAVMPKGQKFSIDGKTNWGDRPGMGFVYSDGFAAEFTVTPETCLSWVVDHCYEQMRQLRERLAKSKDFKNADLNPVDVMEIPEEVMMMATEEDIQLGCMPSLNAYGDRGELVHNGRALMMRCTGMHIHIGSKEVSKENAPRIVKAMDGMVGLAATALFGDEENKWRRRLYGLPGEYRLPKHGLEYRVVSGAMLRHPIRVHFLIDIARYAFQLGVSRLWEVFSENKEKDIKKAILESNQKLAWKLIKKDEELWMPFLRGRYVDGRLELDKLFGVLTGQEKIKTGKFVDNWRFGKWIYHSEGPNCSVHKAVLA